MLNHRNRQREYQYSKLQLGKDSDDEGEETELYVRKPPFKEIQTEERTIVDGDTLQSLSIRYHCPISELKRLNNIHKENEIYARNTIKVPAYPITAILAGVHKSGKSSPEVKTVDMNINAATNVIDTNLLENKLTNLNFPSQKNDDFNAVIFNSNISKNCDIDDINTIDNIEEEVQLLPSRSISYEEEPVVISRISISGVDADISWITLVVCVVIVIFAIPLIYVFYIAEHPEVYHHKTHRNFT